MKLIPYIYLSSDMKWWPGLIIKSVSAMAEPVTVFVDNEAGNQIKELPMALTPRQLKVLGTSELGITPGRYSLRVEAADSVLVTLLQGGAQSFAYDDAVQIDNTAGIDPLAAVLIENSFWLRYNGQASCRYIRRKYHDQLQAAALAAMRLPGRFDNVLNVGDACPLVGSCAGHPSQHSGFYGVDVDYPTIRTNLTQYRVQTGNIFELTNLWDGDVLNGNLDKARCYEIWSNLPGTTISVDPRILSAVQAWATANGKDLSKISGVQGDPNSLEYNHHTHMHIKFNDM